MTLCAKCIDAVDSGRADYAYGNATTVQYYANNDQYRNISLVPQSGTTQELSASACPSRWT